MTRAADLVFDLRHAAALEGAAVVGEAAGGERLVVRIGLWLDAGRVIRARFRATTCPALLAYAEAACALAEARGDLAGIDEAALRREVEGVHPVHRGRAALVADALRAAAVRARGGAAP